MLPVLRGHGDLEKQTRRLCAARGLQHNQQNHVFNSTDLDPSFLLDVGAERSLLVDGCIERVFKQRMERQFLIDAQIIWRNFVALCKVFWGLQEVAWRQFLSRWQLPLFLPKLVSCAEVPCHCKPVSVQINCGKVYVTASGKEWFPQLYSNINS